MTFSFKAQKLFVSLGAVSSLAQRRNPSICEQCGTADIYLISIICLKLFESTRLPRMCARGHANIF